MTDSTTAAIAAARVSLDIIEVNHVRTVHLEDVSTGRVHIGFQREIDDYPATFAGCLSPEAGERREITEAEANAKREKLRCLRCFVRRSTRPTETRSEIGGVPV